MLTKSRRSSALSIVCIAIALTAANAGSASAASKSCQPKHTVSVWHAGSARVYARPFSTKLKGGGVYRDARVYACSSKFRQRYRLEPHPQEREQDEIYDYHWNGRYLVYSHALFVGAGIQPVVKQLIDLQSGRTTRNLEPSYNGWPTPVDCGVNSWGCVPAKPNFIRIGRARSFLQVYGVMLQLAGGEWRTRYELALYCVNRAFTNYSVTLLDDKLTEADTRTVSVEDESAVWRSSGVERNAKMCTSPS